MTNYHQQMHLYAYTLFENHLKCLIWILAFTTNFCPTTIDLSGNTVWPQTLDFKKSQKLTIFDELLSTQNVKVARFARDFLFDFQTLCYCCFVILLLFLLLPSIFYIAFLGPFIPLIVLLQVKEKKSFSLTHYSNDTFLVQLYILGQRVKVIVVL